MASFAGLLNVLTAALLLISAAANSPLPSPASSLNSPPWKWTPIIEPPSSSPPMTLPPSPEVSPPVTSPEISPLPSSDGTSPPVFSPESSDAPASSTPSLNGGTESSAPALAPVEGNGNGGGGKRITIGGSIAVGLMAMVLIV